ncbi:MAG: SUMF1/EgtB/PvdO family nonheme iron enzyme [Planctomycetes bacterium]|nr:SUMF1/EgtB/PvdO family nonheme iron enzyme [Planctomycetota bacterium]
MDGFTQSYIAGVATALTTNIISGALKKIRRNVGNPQEQAIRECVRVGIIGTLTRVSDGLSQDETMLLKDIFESFFNNNDVGRELAGILTGKELDMEEMNGLFVEAGYDPETLPGIPFEQAIFTFEAAFIEAMDEEPVLQPIIQIKILKESAHIQKDLLGEMRDLVRVVKDVDFEKIVIRAGKLMLEAMGEEMRVVYETERIPDRVSGDLEGFYLRRIIAKCDQLDLSAIDDTTLQGQASGEKGLIKISDVFTTLYLKGLTRTPGQSIIEALSRNRDRNSEEVNRDDKESVPIQAIEAVGAMERLVILGRPGGGKSTLTNHILAKLAKIRLGEAKEDEKLSGWAPDTQLVPIRIILREFAAWIPQNEKCGYDGLVWDYIEHLLKKWGCKEYFSPLKHKLDNEGGVIFFDGLDEVREKDEERKRSIIVTAVGEFATPLKKCRIIVTCREYAYQKGSPWRLPESDFHVVELDLFKAEQIKAFIGTWYKTTGKWYGWDEKRCDAEAEVLYKAVVSLPHLRELGQYPLLLTLMSQVHGRDGYLPEDRADLYERAVNLLLSHWENRIVRDEQGGFSVEQGIIMQLGIRTDSIRKALEKVSLAAHERQQKEGGDRSQCAGVPREDLREELASDPDIDRNQAEKIIVYIQERAGLLQAEDNKTFTFPHRTFQEYLAASCIRRMGDYEDYLKERIHDDLQWWREVFLLAAGSFRDTPKNIYQLIDTLIPDEYDEEKMSIEIILYSELAAQAMDETGFVKSVSEESLKGPGRFSKIHKRVVGWLLGAITADEILKPAERVSAGAALAKIGDPRFDPAMWHLPKEKEHDLGFIRIEAGKFQMGSSKGDADADDEEFPSHIVHVSEFYISRYPVTVAQFRSFVGDSGYDAGEDWKKGVDNHPVVEVSWNDSAAFCKWLSGKLKKEVRLPTEAEWEKAARGTTESIYPWGDKPDNNRMNCYETGIGSSSPVGCFSDGGNPFGLQDMNGNVWEWVQDWFDSGYYANSSRDNPQGPSKGAYRVIRGGGWGNDVGRCRSSLRSDFDPSYGNISLGFRLVLPRPAERKSE